MLRKFLHKWLPSPQHVREHHSLRVFGRMLQQPNLWHLNRRSVPRAFAVGLFCAFLPIPGQMLVAAAFAILFCANLPISIALVWISNPITIPPLFWFNYQVGRWVLNSPPVSFEFQWQWAWFVSELFQIGLPLLLGSLICGTIAAIVGYASMVLYWRRYVMNTWRTRHRPKVKKVLHDIIDPHE